MQFYELQNIHSAPLMPSQLQTRVSLLQFRCGAGLDPEFTADSKALPPHSEIAGRTEETNKTIFTHRIDIHTDSCLSTLFAATET